MRGGANANSNPVVIPAVTANSVAKPVSNAVVNEGAKSSGITGWFSSLSSFFKPAPPKQALLQNVQKQNGPPEIKGGRRRRKTKRVKFRRRKSLRR